MHKTGLFFKTVFFSRISIDRGCFSINQNCFKILREPLFVLINRN